MLILISSCKKEKLNYHPFEINRNISCNDLYENGFRRTFGIDVMMIGKKINDTIIHYEVNYPPIESIVDYNEFEEESIPSEIDSTQTANIYQMFSDYDPLSISDSLYNVIWQDLKVQQKDVCIEGKVVWRNFMLELEQFEAENYRKTIDSNKYKILNIEKESNYSIDEFKVINLISKDTFNCSIYEQNKKYYFSSTYALINYE